MSKSSTLVLFDIDGTIIRRAGDHHKEALIEGIRRVTGLGVSMDNIATAGTLDRDLITLMMQAAGCSERRIRASLRDILTECQHVYAASCPQDLSPFLCPGIRDVLEKLRERNAAIGLVTGNLSQIGWLKMELAGLREFFSIGAFAEDGRTRARLAKVAAGRARQKGFALRNALTSLIGDHTNDVKAAKINGFQSIAVATGLTPAEELRAAGADIVVNDLSELPIERLLSGGSL